MQFYAKDHDCVPVCRVIWKSKLKLFGVLNLVHKMQLGHEACLKFQGKHNLHIRQVIIMYIMKGDKASLSKEVS